MGELQGSRATAASETAVHMVSYLEVMPSSMGEAAAGLRQYREASRKDEGRLEVLQQQGRPDHFAILEMWKDPNAFETHGIAAHTQHFRTQLQPLCVSPYDERLYISLMRSATLAAPVQGATYVLTHADAVPAVKDDAIALLLLLAEASRSDDGCLRFEILQQSSRPNHCTIVEMWQNQKALEAHVMALHTRQFREKFQPMTGSLYDERLYQALD